MRPPSVTLVGMDSDAHALLHGPLFSRRTPLDRDNAASRISAYIYGNVLVLAALVPIITGPKYVGIAIVLGTALSTFVAHAFAEAVGHTVRQGTPLTRAEKIAELRNSVPILSSAVLPCVILGLGWLGWLEPRTAQLLAEVAVLLRIGGIVFVIGRLNGERPGRTSLVSAVALTAVAATVVLVKVILTH
ncbi:hypothetical protein RAJCM14343_3766 [Rhodococcus aetherivorans]|uniref:Integral membrane protein n=2 Tax=Rhodococcus aetherivorans TaxID=191292 RepID=A0ABQ0YPJ0_9NOCA|nr:hypothetical protein RAJCM14343_3766 [Rhodococcus aetherivorans]